MAVVSSSSTRGQEEKINELKVFDQERRKYEIKIDKLGKEIGRLEGSVEHSKGLAEDKEKAIKVSLQFNLVT